MMAHFALLMFLLMHFSMQARDFSIVSHGAVGDGKTLNTSAIQATIDEAYASGGGRVIVPRGRFLSGSIVLKSNVELHLEKGAIILGSTDPKQYIQLHNNTCVGYKALLLAYQSEHIALTGQGTLDGQGSRLALNIDSLFYIGQIDSVQYEFPEKRPKWFLRPQVIQFFDCKDVRVEEVTVKNSACWVQTYVLCQDLRIDRIRVESDAYWNNDGIDIVDCRRVRVTRCDINAADDGICLKSYLGHIYYTHPSITSCDSILIENCRVRSSASAVKFGSASFGGFRNIVIRKIRVYDTFRSAIALEMVGGGVLENVLVDGVRATNTGNAIFIRLGQMHREPGILRNIVIRNMAVQVPWRRPDYDYEMRGPALPFFHNVFPSSIVGLPGHPVENVTLENILITYPGRGNPAYANLPLSRLDQVPELPKKYPEFSMFGELPAWGIYARHVNGLTMRNMRIQIRKPDYRPAVVLDDVQGFSKQQLQIDGDDKSGDDVVNHNGR
ncbi:MAG: glycoside hydrolase family 28 protein [Bacteroidia bacterium]